MISATQNIFIDLLAIFINYQSAIIMDNMQESHNNYQSIFLFATNQSLTLQNSIIIAIMCGYSYAMNIN